MAYEDICSLDDVWEGEMAGFQTASGVAVLIAVLEGGVVKAYQGLCPHQQISLAEGSLEDNVLTCRAHLWQFDITTGQGINPSQCRLAEFPTRVSGERILVDVERGEAVRTGI